MFDPDIEEFNDMDEFDEAYEQEFLDHELIYDDDDADYIKIKRPEYITEEWGWEWI